LSKALTSSTAALVVLLKGKLKPICELRGLPWLVVEPPIDALDTAEEIQAAITDPDGFLSKALTSSTVALVALLKGKLKPICELRGLPWDDMQPTVDSLDTAPKLQAAIGDPDAFISTALASSTAGLIVMLKTKLKPICKKKGVPWSVVEPKMNALDTAEEIQSVVADVEGFVSKVLASSADALMFMLKGRLQAICELRRMPWSIVEPIIDAIDTVQELQDVLADPEAFLSQTMKGVMQPLIVQLKEKLRPMCEAKGLPWDRVEAAIDALDTPVKVRSALSDQQVPPRFLQKRA